MNKQWSVVTTLKRGWLTYVSKMFSINCLLNAISSCRLFKQWVQWKVGLRRLRRGGGRMTAAGRPRPVAADSSEEKPIKSWIASTTRSCTSMPLVLLYIAPWSQWSFCSTGDVCIAKQGSYRSTCSQKIRQFIKRWSEAESFTIFENHAYRSKKNLMFAQNFEATSIKVDSCIQE